MYVWMLLMHSFTIADDTQQIIPNDKSVTCGKSVEKRSMGKDSQILFKYE